MKAKSGGRKALEQIAGRNSPASGVVALKRVDAAPPKHFTWRKLSAAKWSDAWLERLAFLGPQRAMVIEFPGARTVRVEAHGVTRPEADGLLMMFGGRVTEAKWSANVDALPRPPIRVRGRLLVVSTEKERLEHSSADRKPAVVLVPPGMAFGTGEHATTATCLRFLSDLAREFSEAPWELLDLGTGSGILGIAARKLGARRVEAADFDPHAVRTAKENVRLNEARGVRVRRFDVRQWSPERTWDVVVSNLFSGLLIETSPKIVAAVAPGGRLVFSGILREQETEVLAAFRCAGIDVERIVRKGKWVSGIGRKGEMAKPEQSRSGRNGG